MEEKYIFEGKTSTEAIEKGLKELKLKKEDVEINILKDEKRSFFSILDPRVVKVEIIKKEKSTKKENKETEVKVKKEKKAMTSEAIHQAKENIEEFLKVFLKQISKEELSFKISNDEYYITVEVLGENFI